MTFVEEVDRALQAVEAGRGGAAHPIRRVPFDLVAESVQNEMRATGAPTHVALGAVLARYQPPSVHVDESVSFP